MEKIKERLEEVNRQIFILEMKDKFDSVDWSLFNTLVNERNALEKKLKKIEVVIDDETKAIREEILRLKVLIDNLNDAYKGINRHFNDVEILNNYIKSSDELLIECGSSINQFDMVVYVDDILNALYDAINEQKEVLKDTEEELERMIKNGSSDID